MLDSPSAPPPAPPTRFRLPVLLALVFCIQFALMPAFLIEGDAVAVRSITARFLYAGKISIPVEFTDLLESFGENRGQYFFLHPDGDRLYSKYGVLNAMLYVPPVWAHRHLTGIEDPFTFSHSLVFLLNLYNILFAMLIAHRLLRIAGLYTVRRGTAWIFVLATLYASFLWYYLRAQGGEIFQVYFWLSTYDHFIRALRGSRRELGLALVWLVGLILLKDYYILLLPAMTLAWWWALRSQPVRDRLRSVAAIFIPTGAAMALMIMAIHAWKFGSPFETGYSQFEPDAFTLLPRWAALTGFLFRPDRSLPLHAPAILIGLAGWRTFARRFSTEAVFTGAVSVTIIGFVSTFVNWPGHWCYGPRYLLILVPILSAPMMFVLDHLADARRQVIRLGLVAVLLLSAALQWKVIGKRFFLAYEISGMLGNAGVHDVARLTGSRNFGLLYVEFDRFARGGIEGPVIRQLRAEVPEETARRVEDLLRVQLVSNYFWLYPIEPE